MVRGWCFIYVDTVFLTSDEILDNVYSRVKQTVPIYEISQKCSYLILKNRLYNPLWIGTDAAINLKKNNIQNKKTNLPLFLKINKNGIYF